VGVVQARQAPHLLGAHHEVLAAHGRQRDHRDLAAEDGVQPAGGGVDRTGRQPLCPGRVVLVRGMTGRDRIVSRRRGHARTSQPVGAQPEG
jgi:hypothetical protein